ncbi:MAG: hypothetical protein HQL51_07005 [Magnetococcales bacterium]|nr:hypothetical protein [Magnetococcales bacterium]
MEKRQPRSPSEVNMQQHERSWWRRHPMATFFLVSWSLIYLKWIFIAPDWYWIETFPWRKEALSELVKMLAEDEPKHPGNDRCCVVSLDDWGNIQEFGNSYELGAERLEQYRAMMWKAGVMSVSRLRYNDGPITFLINYKMIGENLEFLYWDKPMESCEKTIIDITEGMPAFNCQKLDENWYLYHVRGG